MPQLRADSPFLPTRPVRPAFYEPERRPASFRTVELDVPDVSCRQSIRDSRSLSEERFQGAPRLLRGLLGQEVAGGQAFTLDVDGPASPCLDDLTALV